MFSKVPVYLWYVFGIIYCVLAVYVAPVLVADSAHAKNVLVVVGTFAGFAFGMSLVRGDILKFFGIVLGFLIFHMLLQDVSLLVVLMLGIHAGIAGILGGGMLFAYRGGVMAAMRGESLQVKDIPESGIGDAILNEKNQSNIITAALIIAVVVLDIVFSMAWARLFLGSSFIDDKYFDTISSSSVFHTFLVFIPQIAILITLILLIRSLQKISGKKSVIITVSYLFISWIVFTVFGTDTSTYVSDVYVMLYDSHASYYVNIMYILLLGLGVILSRLMVPFDE